jgi:hypothetical protein
MLPIYPAIKLCLYVDGTSDYVTDYLTKGWDPLRMGYFDNFDNEFQNKYDKTL